MSSINTYDYGSGEGASTEVNIGREGGGLKSALYGAPDINSLNSAAFPPPDSVGEPSNDSSNFLPQSIFSFANATKGGSLRENSESATSTATTSSSTTTTTTTSTSKPRKKSFSR